MRRDSTLAARVVLAAAALAILLPGTSCAPTGDPDSVQPNVLLVVLDTTRDDFVGRRDLATPTTPTIDRLIAEGIRFTTAYSTSNWTLPAHASLFTGLYPSQAGATAETLHLPQEVETLAERLGAAGWSTFAAAANPWIARERGFDQGFDGFVEAWRDLPDRPAAPPDGDAAEFILESVERDEPFFVFMNLNTPHLPFNPHPAVGRTFVDPDWPGQRVRYLRTIRGMFPLLAGTLQLRPDDFSIMRELYAAEIHMADALLGNVIDALEQSGAMDDTLIIVTSDHGENIGEHGRIGHGLCRHETTLRVPLVVRYPERVAPGTRFEEPVSLVDVMPTVLDVLGQATDAERAQVEAASLLRLDGDGPRRAFIAAEAARPMLTIEELGEHFPEFDAEPFDHRTRVVREGRYKLVWNVGRESQLYDLEADPRELRNLIGRLPEVEARLSERLRDWMAAIDTSSDVPRFESDDPESLERLRSLGYIH